MSSQSGVSRRSFFQGIARGSAIAACTLTEVKMAFAQSVQKLAGDAAKSHDAWGTDGGYWEKVRKQFMLEDGFAYLNTGTLGPTPRVVVKALDDYWKLMAVNPNENSQIFQDRQEQIRTKAAAFVGATPDEIAITRNTTEGTTVLTYGLDLKPGDEVLVTQYEHNSLKETRSRHAKRFGYVLKEVKFPMPTSHQEMVSAFEAAITPHTRVIHFGNPLGGYGCFTPVKQLAALARSKNILCFVDGAHCPGMVQFSLSDWGVDGFACNSHKWLCGAAGAGLLYVRKEVQDRVHPVISIAHEDPKGARKYDQLSRRPWPVVAAFEDILDFHMAIGRARLEQRTRALGSYLRTNAAEIPKVKVYTPNDPIMSCGSSTIGIEGVSGGRLREYLRQKYDAYTPSGGTSVRISTHFFNTYEQVDRVLKALKELSTGVA
jgi:selenocysteine lyase/cysteine desulfurase